MSSRPPAVPSPGKRCPVCAHDRPGWMFISLSNLRVGLTHCVSCRISHTLTNEKREPPTVDGRVLEASDLKQRAEDRVRGFITARQRNNAAPEGAEEEPWTKWPNPPGPADQSNLPGQYANESTSTQNALAASGALSANTAQYPLSTAAGARLLNAQMGIIHERLRKMSDITGGIYDEDAPLAAPMDFPQRLFPVVMTALDQLENACHSNRVAHSAETADDRPDDEAGHGSSKDATWDADETSG
ncbi:MAG: hypothetical protein M1831_001017 [Alyxoria varia]|nr:MAG: hypothetical protein M1831_001017 [Alyxoria varia]